MIANYRYAGTSGVVNGLRDSTVALATNQHRDPTLFQGQLRQPLLARDALAALHAVVVSDFKYHPRDRLAFRAWLEAQDQKFLAGLAVKGEAQRARMRGIEARLGELDRARDTRLGPFYRARKEYFDWAYEQAYELNYLYDPVVSIHPDEVSFEAFSKDESSYARLGLRHDLFEGVGDFTCGTTNIDFSARLHRELDRMRDYRKTRFGVAPDGLTVKTEGQDAHKEKKIDLPESWVKGFLQVQSTMALGLTHFHIEPVDLFNVLRFLRRHKARVSPRALRYELVPGKRVRVVFEPWEEVLEFGRCSVWDGPKAMSVRTWGRDRLGTLARLLPSAQRISVYLAGLGLPAVYLLDLGGATFTLGLSGWTDNDWTSGGTKFDLLARRVQVSPTELTACLDGLKKVRRATATGLAQDTTLGVEKTRAALSYLCQVGRAMYDLGGGVYRHRELFPEPFTVNDAAAAVQPPLVGGPGGAALASSSGNPQEVAAQGIFSAGGVLITARRPVPTGGYKLTGSVKGTDGKRYRPLLTADAEGRIVEATCTCAFAERFGLTKGPCEHVLALRLAHMSRLEAEDKGGA